MTIAIMSRMKLRRFLLSAAALPVMLSGVERVHARDPAIDAEVDGYGGTSSGGWTCGPSARVRYAGGAVNAAVSERRAPSGRREGMFAMVGGAAEHEEVTIPAPACVSAPCPDGASAAPPARLLYGAQARLGYAEKTFGLHVGLMVFQGWSSSASTSPDLGWLPEVELTAGDLDRIYGVAGLGSPMPTTLRHPGLYGGFGYTWDTGWGLDLRAGLFRAGPSFDVVTFRSDAAGRVLLTKGLSLRAGAALAKPASDASSAPLDFEVSVGPLFSF
jgi:hypothetical protein